MIILVHTAFHGDNVARNLGQPEYSYYFVLREFRPMLEQLGIVIDIHDPARDVDAIYRNCLKQSVPCVFLSFLPPNKTPMGLACPTIPVFAWEYANIPDEGFSGKTRNDWRRVLKQVGAAITHSTFTVDAVKHAMDAALPIIAAPAPLWDRLAARKLAASPPGSRSSRLRVDGMVIDSRLVKLSNYSKANELACAPEPLPLPDERSEGVSELELEGIVYTSVFNPGDGRKNWVDMISAFCVAFAHMADATLLLKLSHHDISEVVPKMLECMHKGNNFAGRIVIVHGYLRQDDYESMVDATTYAVNTSHGEGQCLPLMEYMSSGKPAIAPRHTAMLDYIDESCAFVVDSFLEPGTWPHDMRQAFRTLREHVQVDSLIQAYRSSYYVAKKEPDTYFAMAAAAKEALRAYCSHAVVAPRLAEFLQAVIAGDPQQARSPSSQ
jgi:glycosyltransferase involved in cell wall biosynthesis